VSVPCGSLKAKVAISGEVAAIGSYKAHDEEGCAHGYVKAVKPSGYKECGSVDAICNCKRCVDIFVNLEAGEVEA